MPKMQFQTVSKVTAQSVDLGESVRVFQSESLVTDSALVVVLVLHTAQLVLSVGV